MSETTPELFPEEGRMEVADRLMGQLLERRGVDVDHPSVRRPSEAAPAPEGVFSIADLGPALMGEGVEYVMPNGKRVCVHGLSQADNQRLIRLSGQRQSNEDVSDPRQRQMLIAEIERDVQVYTVILACRTGKDRTSGEVFLPADFGALRAYLPVGCVQEICRLVDAQSGAPEGLGRGVRRFFDVTQKVCETSLSVCATWDACPDGLKAILTRCASLASGALKRGGWDSGMNSTLNEEAEDLLALASSLTE